MKNIKKSHIFVKDGGRSPHFPAILPFLTTNYTTMLFALLLFLFSLLTSYGERHADDEKDVPDKGEGMGPEGEKSEESDSNPKPE
jgi:hypothetical protein